MEEEVVQEDEGPRSMQIAFVTFYNNYVAGLRSIAACLAPLGHHSRFVHLKALYLPLISFESSGAIRSLRKANPWSMVMVFEEGYVPSPYPSPITIREEELFLEEIGKAIPDAVGFNVQDHTLAEFRRFAGLIRKHFPQIRVLAGGPTAIADPERLFPSADVVCVGEGEEALAEWLEDPSRTDVPGLWFRQNGRVIRNPRHPNLQNLDALPIPIYGVNEVLIEENAVSRKLETIPEYLRDHWVFMSRRGCPLSCSYCIEGIPANREGRPPRRSVDHFIAELEAASRRLQLEEIEFHDPIFVMDEDWLEEFAEKYPPRIGAPFRCNACPGISTRRMFELVRKAGARLVAIELQTADERILADIYHRRSSPSAVRKTILDAQAAGIEHVQCGLIVNSPYLTVQSLRSTFEFLLELPRPVLPFLCPLVRYRGMPISKIDPPPDPLPEEIHRSWNALFLLTRFPQISRKGLSRISQDQEIMDRPDLLERFLSGYVRRLRYLGSKVRLEFPGPFPSRTDVGTFPGQRLAAQRRFPHSYLRLMLRKRRTRYHCGRVPQSEICVSFNSRAADERIAPTSLRKWDGRYDLIVEAVAGNECRRVLDAGCGKGRFIRRLKEDYPALDVFALDFSERMLAYVPSAIHRVLGSLLALPWANESFDCVFCNEVLEHVQDSAGALRELGRVVRRGGYLLIFDKDEAKWGHVQADRWERWFNPDEVVQMLEVEGFSVALRRNVPYDGLDGGDGLFFGCVAEKQAPGSPHVSCHDTVHWSHPG